VIDQFAFDALAAEAKRKQAEADNETSILSSERIKELRIRAKTDLFFLAYGILGYSKMTENLHGDLCNWLEKTSTEQFRLVLLPRGHYKSTILTIAHSIQLALPDDTGLLPWPNNLGPNIRLLIAHETHDSAARFLYSITQHFLSNKLLMGLFPEIVPDPRKHRINKTELELCRDQIWSEPTFDTMGVGARSQGRHYNYIKCDDLIGDKARDSKVEMQSAKDWFDNVQSFFSSFAQDKIDIIGTRWSMDDLYGHISKTYGKRISQYVRAVEEVNPVSKRKEAIFPEQFPLDKLAILRKNKKVWDAQYINNPKEGAAEFNASWKRYFYWHDTDKLKVPGVSKEGNPNPSADRIVNLIDCDKVLFIDPATKTESGLVMTATDNHEPFHIYVIEADEKAYSPPELVNKIFKLVRQWWPRLVVIEEVIFSQVFQHYLKTEMALRSCNFRVVGAKTSQKSKEFRVRGLANYFSDGRIHFNEHQTLLIEEFEEFGARAEYHMLDAMAYGPQFWRIGKSQDDRDRDSEKQDEKLRDRDPRTGYSIQRVA
jgi:hypothetical protein